MVSGNLKERRKRIDLRDANTNQLDMDEFLMLPGLALARSNLQTVLQMYPEQRL
jgi:hypothetical protein